jgi:addiction module HigA family antidote
MTDSDNPIMAPVHPVEMLMEDFLQPLGVSQYRLAQAIGVPARRINEIVHGVDGSALTRRYDFPGTSG